MSSDLREKLLKGPLNDSVPAEASPTAADISSYIAEMIQGLRELTREPVPRELEFLDYLLAMAEDEAGKLSSNVYH